MLVLLFLPTLDCFLIFLISTHQIHLATVPLFVEGVKCIGYERADGSMGYQKSAGLVHIDICIWHLGGLPKNVGLLIWDGGSIIKYLITLN